MIKLKNLELTNFMCVSHALLEFEDNKVILLIGDNGNGKSAVEDAIALCLNESKRGDTYGDYVKLGNETANVKLSADIKGHDLNFDVTLKKGGRDIRIVDNTENKTYNNSEASSFLEGLSVSHYYDIILSMQNKGDITELKPNQRAVYLQDLLNFSFESQLKFCKDKLDNFKSTIKTDTDRIDFNKNSIDIKNSQILDVPEDEFSSKIADLKAAMAVIQEEIVKYSNLSEKQADITNRLNSLLRKKYQVNNTITNLTSLISQYDDITANLKKYEAEITKNRNFIATETSTLNDTNSLLESIDKEIVSIRVSKDDVVAQLADKKAQFNINNKHIALLSSGLCPECGHKFTSEDTEAYNTEHVALVSEITALSSKNDQFLANLEEKEAKKREFQAILNKSTKNIALYNSTNASYTVYCDKYKAQLDEIEKARPQLESANSELSSITESEKSIQEEQTKIAQDIEAYKRMSADLQSAQTQVNNLNVKLMQRENILKANDTLTKEIVLLNENIEKANIEIETLHKEEKTYKEVYQILSKSLPEYMIIKTCKSLEQEINNFIQNIFPTMETRLFQSKTGVEFFYTPDKTKLKEFTKDTLKTVKMASGFEKSVLTIAFKVALCKAYNLEFAFFDEIDQAGSENNSETLYRSIIDSGLFEQVFVISHKPSVRDVIVSIAESTKTYYVSQGFFSLSEPS